jgi:glycerophosphoryl diester phosphodiesterase
MTMRIRTGTILLAALALATACGGADSTMSDKILVAHRGASAYAPEHTRAAYELAIELGADYIEPDLQITADSVLIALHDETLERTTNVEEVFPDRFRQVAEGMVVVNRWFAVDFTLDEIKQLDAGSWFDPRFAGERVPTFAEVIEIARGRAGIFPETKAPDAYTEQGFDMERLVTAELRAHGLDVKDGVPGTPVILQSFSPESLRILRREQGLDLPSVFLIGQYNDARRWFRPEGFAEIREFATGIGPSKDLLQAFPNAVADAHAAGLSVIPYTFGSRDEARFEDVSVETSYFLSSLGVDGLFTNNPDLFPRGG